MTKILKITQITFEEVETDKEDFSIYRRLSSGNWENLMGSSWEREYDYTEIEAAYQKFKKNQEEDDA